MRARVAIDSASAAASCSGLAPITYALAAALLWPIVELAGAQLASHHTAVQVVFLRYAMHLAMLAVYCAASGRIGSLASRRLLWQLIRGVLMFTMPVCFLLARKHAGAGLVWSVFWLAPLLVLAAAPLLGERPRAAQFLGGMLAWIGAMAVLHPRTASVASALYALGMAVSFAGYLLLSRSLAGEKMLANLFYTGLGALLPISVLAVRNWTPVTATDLVPSLDLGLASIAFLFMLDRAVECAPATLVAPAMFAVVAWESLLRHGLPHGAVLLGTVLVIGGVLLAESVHVPDGHARARRIGG